MLWPSHLDYLARKERYKDLIREAERNRLIRALNQQLITLPINRRLIAWMGTQIVRLGMKLETYAASSPRKLA